MFIVIVVIFALCWLPQQAFFLYQYHDSQVLDTDHVQHIYLSFYWLAMANAMVNPIVYYWMNARFRAYFREVMTQCLCLRCTRSHHRQYTASPVLQRRVPSLDRDASSRSRSDSRCQGNGTVRTLPSSLHYRTNHQYYSRERGRYHHQYYSRARGFRLSNKGGGQCEICLQSFQPTPLTFQPKQPAAGTKPLILTTTMNQHRHDAVSPNQVPPKETSDNLSAHSLYHERDPLSDREGLLSAAPHSDEGRWPGVEDRACSKSSTGGRGDHPDLQGLTSCSKVGTPHEDGVDLEQQTPPGDPGGLIK
ncbi:G protein-coupled receptor rhodopsin-like [Trinorchestia longiramus]|nr:G protein-coupled receptor rhodopsin-like [Trinorchestia longiramus]